GDRGVLVLKDFTSILGMNRDSRAALLAAFRELYDGKWVRHVGTDGGLTLQWCGKLGMLAACTTAIDRAHPVMSRMGERGLIVRMSTEDGDDVAARALAQAGYEHAMRAELRAAVAGLFAGDERRPRARTELEQQALIRLARLVALARSPVERDYQGELDLV